MCVYSILTHTYAYTFGAGNTRAPGDLYFLQSIHIDKMDRIYVVENPTRQYARVSVFAPDGTFLYMFGSLGEDNGQLFDPRGVATNSKGHIYVTDEGGTMISGVTAA